MIRKIKPTIQGGASLLLLLLAMGASAQEPALTEREKMLLEKVESLEKRLADVERRLAEQTTPTSSQTHLEQRMTKVEESIESGAAREPNDFRVFWNNGLRFETEDKRFKMRIGGRIHNDWAFIDQDRELEQIFGDEEDGTEFRRARINLQGEIYDTVVFRGEYDFAGNDSDPDFQDVFIGLKNLPLVGNIQVGHFKEPMGLEQLAGNNHITFMEQALPCVLLPGDNLGLMLFNDALSQRLTWAIGAFKDVDAFPSDDDSDEDQGVSITARLTGLPWYRDGGRKLLHLGASYSHRNPDGAVLGFRQRPEAHLANRYVDTGLYNGFRMADARMDDMDVLGLEAAVVYGPFSVQGEYMRADVDTTFAGDRDFDGWYVHASYFLTGENRQYDRTSGTFGRLKLRHNFSLGEQRGWGAWQVAGRYSTLDLDDGIIRGGEENNFTLGLNWYLNPNTRIMLNYVMANIEHDLYSGDLNTFQTRFQVDF